MPKITLNGAEVEFEPGQSVIELARERGIDIPHYCWHPALSVVASCRICQVEVKGPGPERLTTACNTACVDGMVVNTESEEIGRARAGNLEALLLNHPLDCPICDKAGECWLQDYTYEYGAAAGRNDFPRKQREKRKEISEHVLLDQERCILCTRCVRFLDDYVGKPELLVADRGHESVIDIFPGHPVENDYQGNLADICPVGALTLKEFRFVNRVWYLEGTDSVCPSCTRGCSITLDVRKNQVNRVRPRTNPEVNGYFICDEGRFDLKDVYHPKGRLEQVTVDGKPCSLESATKIAAERLKECGDVLVVANRDATNEELLLLEKIAEGARAERKVRLVFWKEDAGEGDDLLRTGQKGANLAGLEALGFTGQTSAQLARAVSTKKGVLYLLDGRLDSVPGSPEMVILQAVTSPLAKHATILLPGATVGEKEGTLTNCDGVTQRVRPALRRPQSVPGDFNALLALGAALGVEGLPRTPGEAFLLFAERLGQATGADALTLAALPANGQRLSATAKAGS